MLSELIIRMGPHDHGLVHQHPQFQIVGSVEEVLHVRETIWGHANQQDVSRQGDCRQGRASVRISGVPATGMFSRSQ
jgi:hypothetical protein